MLDKLSASVKVIRFGSAYFCRSDFDDLACVFAQKPAFVGFSVGPRLNKYPSQNEVCNVSQVCCGACHGRIGTIGIYKQRLRFSSVSDLRDMGSHLCQSLFVHVDLFGSRSPLRIGTTYPVNYGHPLTSCASETYDSISSSTWTDTHGSSATHVTTTWLGKIYLVDH